LALIETYYGPYGHFEPEKDKTKYGPDDKSELFTADSLLNFIRRSNPVWRQSIPKVIGQQWVYRGHWDADWKLIPCAGRSMEYNPLKKLIQSYIDISLIALFPESNPKTQSQQNDEICKAYLGACETKLNDFFIKAYKFGAINKIKDESRGFFNAEIDDPNYFQHTEWLNSYPYLSLAQHHKIPTFLLDWSFDPQVAAYFSTTAPKEYREQQDACIWAIDIGEVIVGKGQITADENPFGRGLYVNEASKSGNQFLTAQNGLFTTLTHGMNTWRETGNYPALEDIISTWTHKGFMQEINQYLEQIHVNGFNEPSRDLETQLEHKAAMEFSGNKPILRKIIVPCTEIPTLKMLLALEEKTKAAVMPTLDNIAEEVMNV